MLKPLFCKNISLMSSLKLHMFTIAMIEREVSLTPLSCGLFMILRSGSTSVMNSILFFSS